MACGGHHRQQQGGQRGGVGDGRAGERGHHDGGQDGDRDEAPADDGTDQIGIALENRAVKTVEKPHQDKRLLALFAGTEEQGAERGAQRQGVEGGNAHGQGQAQGELLV